MKQIRLLAATAAAVLALVIGCGKGEATLDTKALQKSFANAESVIKASADRAVAAAKAKDYGTVLAELSKLANYEKLTPEQKQALNEMVERTRTLAVANPPKNVDKLPMAMPK